ncbi:hypothetical protein [Agrobacterium tumefaciens]|uniref:hypothetical protein n=1 Tax=Agrobacterium tumefaciens TaxID=358 RepID=UPI001573AAA9|nr:hypothetical protein [Agrobacterium tumefaciens]NTA18906.1 hypothetical protein [Agrobacterium tumefaciens]WCK72395.1 hypothetical protein G6L96_014415 [Agrobacterium tumefaciens]
MPRKPFHKASAGLSEVTTIIRSVGDTSDATAPCPYMRAILVLTGRDTQPVD